MTAKQPPLPSADEDAPAAEIALRIRRDGPIPFDQFMELALYSTRGGYYEKCAAIGREGDFYTSSEASAAFGEVLAVQVAEFAKLLGEADFDLVELGGGKGTLASDLLGRLRAGWPSVYGRLTCWMIETSTAMRRSQRTALAAHSPRVLWVDGPEKVRGGAIAGCVIANEFYDALPVRIVARRGPRLVERRVGLREDGGGFAWLEVQAVDPALLGYARRYALAAADGAVAEAGLAASEYASRVARAIRKGWQIVIDYGDRAESLYDPALRPSGTLMAYHNHQASDDPLQRVGRQDITAHVNFSALEDAGRENGLESAGMTTQSRFLIALGMAERIAALAGSAEPREVRRRLGMMGLIHPEGMGGTFRVLVQAKRVPLEGLRGLEDPFAGSAGKFWINPPVR